uniref:Uncharacterized protein n=1 Tax=Manihot esculenta TaxID=3983 RepID=A0A2C9WHI0_MANES
MPWDLGVLCHLPQILTIIFLNFKCNITLLLGNLSMNHHDIYIYIMPNLPILA